MGTEVGGIDARRRPVVRVTTPGDEIGLLALLDTGFNGELLCNVDAARALKIKPQGDVTRVELAGGLRQDAQYGWLQIVWLGLPRLVRVLVSSNAADARLLPNDDEPVALLGTGLLWPHLVLLDFSAGTVEIEALD